MATTVAAVGLTTAATGFADSYVSQSLPKFAFSGGYYRGGFENKITKHEAVLILGISPIANKGKVRDAHLQIMLLNHPDKGESPYIAVKINDTSRFTRRSS
ncbi:mitochondrial import inner membrane translocase subunit TIM14-like [Talpa occidentalis]|uniref:mitochondrial import inner membrane translocase subunit TIM14-like n=1 Tax=Talpa occidentalis TaxID=50954 RepID=UPI00188F3330|nr:mitochondrial import inner membrane translocase subunit TIM14-like [Talpa occidentalis]